MFGFSNECVAKEDWDDFLRDLARFHHSSSKVMEELEGGEFEGVQDGMDGGQSGCFVGT